jgi:hypothetical protein
MKIRYTPNTLDKLEKIIAESGYIIRYERGTFQSGFCILESRKVVVLNKFLQIEGRINTLIDLLSFLNIEQDRLSIESKKLFEDISSAPDVAA